MGLPCCAFIGIDYTRAMQSLKTWMSEHGVNQTKLAEVLDVEQPTVWGWLNGKAYPRTETLVKLSAHTGLTIDELLVGVPRKKDRRKAH